MSKVCSRSHWRISPDIQFPGGQVAVSALNDLIEARRKLGQGIQHQPALPMVKVREGLP
jgi:hypothetical protein